jgi:hypothetical protein
LEKQYRDEYQKEYETKYEEHQVRIAPIISEYNKEVAETRDKYCPTRAPGVAYDPKDPCQQIPKVPEPVLPKLDFQFRSEIEAEYLVSILKPENLDTLLDVLGYEFQNVTADKERGCCRRSLRSSISCWKGGILLLRSMLNHRSKRKCEQNHCTEY